MEHIKRKTIIRIVAWLVGLAFLAVAVVLTVIYLIPANQPTLYTFAIVISLVLFYFVAWTVRGISADTKDTMLADMGEIELEVLKAKIEQILEKRKGSRGEL
jgi:FtsH-binding integral membrane protein